jgi:outer membrane protein assembly factor BamB
MKISLPILLALVWGLANEIDSAAADVLAPIWQYGTGGRIRSRPAVSATGTVYAVSEDGFLYAISPEGRLAWKSDLGWITVDCLAVGVDGSVYAGLKNGFLAAVNPHGKEIWRVRLDGPPSGDPLVSPDGTLYIGTDRGSMFAVSHRGVSEWAASLPASITQPAVMDGSGTVFVVCADRKLYAFTRWGTPAWSLPFASDLTAPAVDPAGGLVLGTSDGELVAVSPTGGIRWSYNAGAPLTAPVIGSAEKGAAAVIFAATKTGAIVALSSTGMLVWRMESGKSFAGGCMLGENAVLALATDGTLIALSRTGSVVGRAPFGTDGGAILAADGTIYVGGQDWLLNAWRAPAASYLDTADPWPQMGHDSGHSGRSGAMRHADNLALLESDPDWLFLESLAEMGTRDAAARLLAEIRARVKAGFPDGSGWYVSRILERIASGGLHNPVYRNMRIVNDWPELRAEAADLLGTIGSLESRMLLISILTSEYDDVAKSSEIAALGSLGSDPDGASSRAIAAVFSKSGAGHPEGRIAAAAVGAIGRLIAYGGGIPDPSASSLLIAVLSGRYPESLRAAAQNFLGTGMRYIQ